MVEHCVALLRGINVGGKNKLPMRELAELFVEAGAKNVRTYIQSGNVLFDAPPATARRIPGRVSALIAERFGLRVPVLLRTIAELREVARSNPFLSGGAGDEDPLHVMFLDGVPAAELVAKLDPRRSPPDEFVALGQEIYLRLRNGVANNKLTNAYFDSKLRTTSSGRNWRTVKQLLTLLEG